jgi:hypothetical protein
VQPAKKITVLGQSWRLVTQNRRRMNETAKSHGMSVRADGLCDWDAKSIFLYDKLSDRDRLNASIHEYHHGANPECTEEWVTERADELTAFIYDVLGYRGPSDAGEHPRQKSD